jgi:hypothetical protein
MDKLQQVEAEQVSILLFYKAILEVPVVVMHQMVQFLRVVQELQVKDLQVVLQHIMDLTTHESHQVAVVQVVQELPLISVPQVMVVLVPFLQY